MARRERSAGFVLFHRTGDAADPSYLLLDYGKHWDFPKGHVEKGEDDLTAAYREVREETGISQVRPLDGFHHEVTYYFRDRRRQLIRKVVVFFLGEVNSTDVVLSDEHVGYDFLPLDAALSRVTYATAKELLRRADEHLRLTDRPPATP